MRALAAALGTGPMTMYNYVSDKEGLEELVVAAVVADDRGTRTDRGLERDVYADGHCDVAGNPCAPRRHTPRADPAHDIGDGIRRQSTH